MPETMSEIDFTNKHYQVLLTAAAADIKMESKSQPHHMWKFSLPSKFECTSVLKNGEPYTGKCDRYSYNQGIELPFYIEPDNRDEFDCLIEGNIARNTTILMTRQEYDTYANWLLSFKYDGRMPRFGLKLSKQEVGSVTLSLATHPQMAWEEEAVIAFQKIAVSALPN